MDYEAADKAALRTALLGLHVCPNRQCGRTDLQPVAFSEDTWGCAGCRETWYLPTEAKPIRCEAGFQSKHGVQSVCEKPSGHLGNCIGRRAQHWLHVEAQAKDGK